MFLEYLRDDLNIDLTGTGTFKEIVASLKNREVVGRTNGLLIRDTGKAITISLHIKLQPGTGQVSCQIKGSEDFRDAVVRAHSAMRERGFLSGSEDVFYTLELTDVRYQGSSLAVAAAVAMHDVKLNLANDPYTAFTGDINLDGQEWTIKPVSGVVQKIEAAQFSGCRRVFIPRSNSAEVTTLTSANNIIGVDSLTDLFIQLRPGRQPLKSDSLQGKKVTLLQQYCRNHGWDLSPPQPIQGGMQFTIVPLEISPQKVQIYDTGAHSPKTTSQNEYIELLSLLNETDQPETPIRNINETLNLQSSTLWDQIQSAIEKLGPTESRMEQYCKYSFKFIRQNETLTVKQYNSGKLTIQGLAGPLYRSILECVVPLYKVHFPTSEISTDKFLVSNITKSAPRQSSNNGLIEVPLPHIGTDESGKGDYFGPMVIAGVLIDSTTETALKELGVKDSKTLTDKRCKELAVKIRHLLPGKYEEVEILPERYNQLYEQFKDEGKNLNHLLAWGHARAIESLLQKGTCSHAIADQFGDENYIRSKLMEKGRKLQLIQLPKGERYIAVAAASILARDRFLSRMESFRDSYKLELPKGASGTVVNAAKQFIQTNGENSLGKIAKMHHKTTRAIVG